MTVAELIAKLQTMPQEATVVIYYEELAGYGTITQAEFKTNAYVEDIGLKTDVVYLYGV